MRQARVSAMCRRERKSPQYLPGAYTCSYISPRTGAMLLQVQDQTRMCVGMYRVSPLFFCNMHIFATRMRCDKAAATAASCVHTNV